MKTWRTGNGDEVADVRSHLKTRIKTGLYKSLIIGCDSQVHRKRVVFVTVIILDTDGSGAQFVYTKDVLKRSEFHSINERLLKETEFSVDIALDILDIVDEFGMKIAIHADVNPNERWASNKVINEVVGWITGMGFDCHVKPDAFASSSVADRFA
jgi:uncharacterized protein